MIPFAASAERYSQWLRELLKNEVAVPFPQIEGKELARTVVADGTLLSVPLVGGSAILKRRAPRELMISDHGRWQDVHLGALRALYGKTPYFIHFYPHIERIYKECSEGSLGDFTSRLHEVICKGMGLDVYAVNSVRKLSTEEKERFERIGREKRQIINMHHSILEVLFRLGKEGLFVLL